MHLPLLPSHRAGTGQLLVLACSGLGLTQGCIHLGPGTWRGQGQHCHPSRARVVPALV